MKKLIVIAALALLPTFVFAQGQVNFFTFNATNAALGQVLQNNGTPADSTFSGQLYGSTVNNTLSLTPEGSPVAFSGSSGYLNAGTITLDNGAGGATYFYELRAWKGAATYALAQGTVGAQWGKSAIVQIVAGGGSPPSPVPTSNLQANFTLALNPVPEPSTIFLSILGAAALFLRRRKSA